MNIKPDKKCEKCGDTVFLFEIHKFYVMAKIGSRNSI